MFLKRKIAPGFVTTTPLKKNLKQLFLPLRKNNSSVRLILEFHLFFLDFFSLLCVALLSEAALNWGNKSRYICILIGLTG